MSTIIAIVIICINIFSNQRKSRVSFTVCNEQDRLNIYMRYNDYDFIIAPTSFKNMSFCLGKAMSFNDRKIEYVVNSSDQFKKEIKERYTVENFITKNKLKVGALMISIKRNEITFMGTTKNVIINTRPAVSMLDISNKGLSNVNLLIRPLSSDDIETLLNNLSIEQHKVLNGDYYRFNF